VTGSGQLREVLAVEQLHHEVGRTAVEPPDVEHPADVVAAQPRAGLGLAQEPRDHAGVLGHRLVQHLDGNALLELKVGRDRDHAHAALAEDALDAEPVADDRADL
jgi:hypothetical protein